MYNSKNINGNYYVGQNHQFQANAPWHIVKVVQNRTVDREKPHVVCTFHKDTGAFEWRRTALMDEADKPFIEQWCKANL